MEQKIMSSLTSTTTEVPPPPPPQTISSSSTTSSSTIIQPPSTSRQQQQNQLIHDQKSILTRSSTMIPQSTIMATRPEDLRVRPWYAVAVDKRTSTFLASKNSPLNIGPADQSSCPVNHQSYDFDINNREEIANRYYPDATSTRTSSIESEAPRSTVQRKAYMDLNDAMALLDETCPNPDVSPQMTPRTPSTPHPRNKRARSKSSDNSSNYSCEKLNERSDGAKEKDRKRPFLKKIGISMTEDRPLLAKLAPRIMGKPYLEKIGPSRAVEKPFLEKIGSSRTLDKFIFDAPKKKEIEKMNNNNNNNSSRTTIPEEPETKASLDRRNEIRGFSTGERRRSGKNFLLKMYSFETEDLEDNSLAMKAPHRDPLRGASLDDVLETGSRSSMPRINELCATTTISDVETPNTSVIELVRCRVTTSEEIISSSSCLNSPMDLVNNSWDNSPKRNAKNDRQALNDSVVIFKKIDGSGKSLDKNSIPNSPTKRTHSITPEKITSIETSSIVRENFEKKMKNGRQSSYEIMLDKRKGKFDSSFETRSSDNLTKDRVATPVFAEINGKGGSSSSVMSSASSTRLFNDKFDSQELFKDSYAEFKLRSQGNFNSSNAIKRLVVREKTISPSFDLGFSSKEAMLEKIKSEDSPKVRSKSAETERQKKIVKIEDEVITKATTESFGRRSRNRSVLRKQQGIDHSNEHIEINLTNQRKKIVQHEPSQETLDLLTELQKVKSQLKSPTIDELENNDTKLKSFPKRILLTDKEFCLSVERENSIRLTSRNNTLEKSPEKKNKILTQFEKQCLTLDYADDENSTTSKTNKSPLSIGEKDLAICDSKSYSSDETIPNNSTLEDSIVKDKKVIKKHHRNKTSKLLKDDRIRDRSKSPRTVVEIIEKLVETTDDQRQKNYYSELSIETSRDQQLSPNKKKTTNNDTFDVPPSPKATAFRMKKRLGRISVEETVKQESFTVANKVDCKEVTVQKKTKCLPL